MTRNQREATAALVAANVLPAKRLKELMRPVGFDAGLQEVRDAAEHLRTLASRGGGRKPGP